MAKDPAFLFYPGDYLRDTQCLSEKSQVAYDRIMCEHMRNISKDMINITISYEKTSFFMKRLSEDEKSELYQVLKKVGEGYQIEWVAISISKRKRYSESRAENRSGKSEEDMKTYDSHMENENGNRIKEGLETIKESFEVFWNAYEKKVGKPKTLREWQKLTDEERITVMKYIPAYKLNKEKQFRKDPERFLKNKCWNDELVSPETKTEVKHTGYIVDPNKFYNRE